MKKWFVLLLVALSLGFTLQLTAAHDEDDDHGRRVFVTRLSGAEEVPGPGDPDGRGTAVITVNVRRSEVCWFIRVRRIGLPATAAHIHNAVEGVAGPVVVGLTPPGANGVSFGCAAGLAPDLVKAIARHPENYYVNVHNAEFPSGALRGQLD